MNLEGNIKKRKQVNEPNSGPCSSLQYVLQTTVTDTRVRQNDYLDSFLCFGHTQLSCSVNYTDGHTVTRTSHPGSLHK